MLTFEYPATLLLVGLPIIYGILKLKHKINEITIPLAFSDWQGDSFTWKHPFFNSIFFVSRILLTAGYISLVFTLAEPSLKIKKKYFSDVSAQTIFVVDTSPSMAALDTPEINRLSGAKRAIKNIVTQNEGLAYGLVAVGSEAALLVPPTVDYPLFLERLENLNIGEMGEGSALGLGLTTAIYHLTAVQNHHKIIILLTDGENNAGSIHPKTATLLARDKGITIIIIGIGKKGTVPIEYAEPNTGKVYSGYLDSGFNETQLKNLASFANGQYISAETTEDIFLSLEHIALKNFNTQNFIIKNEKKSLTLFFMLCATIFFSCAWIISRLLLREIL